MPQQFRRHRKKRRNPIRHTPLRNPGQSLRETLDDYVFDKLGFWVMLCVVFYLFAFVEWLQAVLHQPRRPLLFLVAALGFTVIGSVRILFVKRRACIMLTGLQGEIAVGQFLDEQVRSRGYRVFHDIVEKDAGGVLYNIDHVLIGPGGVFTIETKTRTKPASGEPKIRYENGMVSVDGGPFDADPIRQARGAASRVAEILRESTGRSSIAVRPVVLYPGWYIDGRSSGQDVWVLEPKALPSWLDHESVRLTQEDVALYASRLARHVRDG